MVAITTFASKGAPINDEENDANLNNLNNGKLEANIWAANNTIVIRDKDGTLVHKVISEDSIIGRLAGGNIGELTAEQLTTLLSLSISDIEGLQSAINGKADEDHSHAIEDVTDLQDELDGKAASSHAHGISDITDLQSELDDKSDDGHGHAIVEIGGLDAALAEIGTQLNDAKILKFGTGTLSSGQYLIGVEGATAADTIAILIPAGGSGDDPGYLRAEVTTDQVNVYSSDVTDDNDFHYLIIKDIS